MQNPCTAGTDGPGRTDDSAAGTVSLAAEVDRDEEIGFVTGSLAARIVERVSDAADREPNATEATRADVAALMPELRRLRTEPAELRRAAAAVPAQRDLADP